MKISTDKNFPIYSIRYSSIYLAHMSQCYSVSNSVMHSKYATEQYLSSIRDCHKWFPSIYCVPYSGKLLREKTFVNFTVLWLYAKVFSARFGAWHPLALQKRAIRESFLRENHIFTHSRKFSPSKVSRYTVSAFARL